MKEAVELSSDLRRFIERVESSPCNGIIGKVRNAFDLDAGQLMSRMLGVARGDVSGLLDKGRDDAAPGNP